MNIISVLLFAVSANLDSLVIGLSYGLKHTKIGLRPNLIISAVIFAGTLLSMLCGNGISAILPATIASSIGGVLIVLIGLYAFFSSLFRPEGDDQPTKLSFLSAAALGGFLALNNMGLGIGASMAGLSALYTPFACFTVNLLFISLGNRLGHLSSAVFFKRYAEPAAAVIIILLGVYELIL